MVSKERMSEFEKRMAEKKEKPPTHPGPQTLPWTAKVERALHEQMGKGLRCKACNYNNLPKSHIILYVVRFELLRELIPMPTYVCNSCGTHFTPPAFRKIIKAAMQKQEKMVEEHRQATGGGGGA